MVGWKKWVGKKVYITSRNYDHGFTGVVESVDEGVTSFLTIIDKYGQMVTFSTAEITIIREQRE